MAAAVTTVAEGVLFCLKILSVVHYCLVLRFAVRLLRLFVFVGGMDGPVLAQIGQRSSVSFLSFLLRNHLYKFVPVADCFDFHFRIPVPAFD